MIWWQIVVNIQQIILIARELCLRIRTHRESTWCSPFEDQTLNENGEKQIERPARCRTAIIAVLHRRRLLTIEHMHQDTRSIWRRWRAGVITAVGGQCSWNKQAAGACLFLSDNTNSTTLGVVDHITTAIPVDEAGRVRRLQDYAGEVDVAAAFDIQLGVAKDLCLGD